MAVENFKHYSNPFQLTYPAHPRWSMRHMMHIPNKAKVELVERYGNNMSSTELFTAVEISMQGIASYRDTLHMENLSLMGDIEDGQIRYPEIPRECVDDRNQNRLPDTLSWFAGRALKAFDTNNYFAKIDSRTKYIAKYAFDLGGVSQFGRPERTKPTDDLVWYLPGQLEHDQRFTNLKVYNYNEPDMPLNGAFGPHAVGRSGNDGVSMAYGQRSRGILDVDALVTDRANYPRLQHLRLFKKSVSLLLVSQMPANLRKIFPLSGEDLQAWEHAKESKDPNKYRVMNTDRLEQLDLTVNEILNESAQRFRNGEKIQDFVLPLHTSVIAIADNPHSNNPHPAHEQGKTHKIIKTSSMFRY